MNERMEKHMDKAKAKRVTLPDVIQTVDGSTIHSALRAAIERDKAELQELREAKAELLSVCERTLSCHAALGFLTQAVEDKLRATFKKHGGQP